MLSRVFKENQTSRNSDRSEATPKYRRHLNLDICPRRSDPKPLHHGIEGGGFNLQALRRSIFATDPPSAHLEHASQMFAHHDAQ